jgi:inactive STAND
VAEEYYKLKPDGIDAVHELLLLLDIQPRSRGQWKGTFNAKEIKEKFFKTTLARVKTLTPLLNPDDKSRSVDLKKTKEFFVELIERVAADYRRKSDRQSINEKLLGQLKYPTVSNQGLQGYLIACINNDDETKDKWDFPVDDLLEEVDYANDSYQPTKDILQKQAVFQQSSSLPKESKCKDIVNLLWHLDYQDQEYTFIEALRENNQCMSFSIVAPCVDTQKWILSRLLRQVKWVDPNKIKVIELNKSPMRFDPELLWEEFSPSSQMPLKQTGQDEIIKMLCSYAAEAPVIFIIHSFDKSESAQEYIITDFWNRINTQIPSNVVNFPFMLFLVDTFRPTCLPANITKLAPLEMITQGHVESWSHIYKDFNYYANQLNQKTEWPIDKWRWANPYAVIDRICHEFGFKNGIVDIEESWKWTL